MKGYFGIDNKELKRMKKDTVGFCKRVKKKSDKYNFGVSKKDLERYRKQARA